MPKQRRDKSNAGDDPRFRVYYAQACLDYTMRTNQTNEARMTKLLTVSIGALAAAGLLLGRIQSTDPGLNQVVFHGALVASLFLICSIFVLIRGITPVSEDKHSPMVNDHVAARPVESYIDELVAHGPLEAQRTILRENAAMARVVLGRQHAYQRSRDLFYIGGLLLVLSSFLAALLKV